MHCRRRLRRIRCCVSDPASSNLERDVDYSPRSHQKKVYKIFNLTDEEATLVEPASCAIHGADKLNLPVGSEVLILGSGPTGWSFNIALASSMLISMF